MTAGLQTFPRPEFEPWDHVHKSRGYSARMTVLSVFQRRDGQWRLVCESEVRPGMLFVFESGQVTKVHD